jgi:hypothetical protein
LDQRLAKKIHSLIETIRNAEAELEITMADSETLKKRLPQKCRLRNFEKKIAAKMQQLRGRRAYSADLH